VITEEAGIRVGDVEIKGDISVPADAFGVVLFAHGSGSSRFSPRNRQVAKTLQQAGLAILLMDLLTEREDAVDARKARFRFDILLLAERVAGSTGWLVGREGIGELPVG